MKIYAFPKIVVAFVIFSFAYKSAIGGDEVTWQFTGEVFIVISTSVSDFSQVLNEYHVNNASEFEKHMGDLRNYTIEVVEHESYFSVIFSPKDFEGSLVAGGGGEYSIEKGTYEILSKEYFK